MNKTISMNINFIRQNRLMHNVNLFGKCFNIKNFSTLNSKYMKAIIQDKFGDKNTLILGEAEMV